MSKRERRLHIGFVVVIISTYVLSVVIGWMRSGTPSVAHVVLEPAVFPVLYFYAPPLLAAYNDFRRGSIFGSLLLGITPGLTFPILAGLAMLIRTGPADSPAWVLTLAFLGIGVVVALGGILCSRLLRSIRASLGAEAEE